jgi:hypothetical protein
MAGCGEGDDSKDVAELLDKAFKSSIGSADVKLEVQVELEGIEEIDDPIELNLSGPYKSGGDDQIPSVDFEITVSAQNQSFNAALTSTGDRAFISFQGTAYEVSQATVEALNRQLAENSKNGDDNRSLGDFGVQARDWIVNAEQEGDEEVAGVETDHVSGELDVTRVLDDLNTVVQEASKLGGGIAQSAPPQLTDEQKAQVEEVVDDPRFDAYVGKEDGKLHRLSADLEFEVPEDSRERVGGLEGGKIAFSIEFSDIGGNQQVVAPENPRPIEELVTQLRGLLGGALGGGQVPGTGDGGGSGGLDGGGSEQTDPEKQEAYEECVKTDPDDPQVKAFCEVLLQ